MLLVLVMGNPQRNPGQGGIDGIGGSGRTGENIGNIDGVGSGRTSQNIENIDGVGSGRTGENVGSVGSIGGVGNGSGLFQVTAHAEEGYDQVAGSSSMGQVNEDLAPYGMTPVSGSLIEDGEYIVGTESSSSFFRIEEAKLTVRDGRITALLKMYSSSYLLVYPGTAEEAAAAAYEDYIPSVDVDGWDTFTVPVEALDMPVDLAAYSKKKKKWYPRKILFHASDLPADSLKFDYPDYDRISAALAAYEETESGRASGPQGETSAEENLPQSAAGTEASGTGNPASLVETAAEENLPQNAAGTEASGAGSPALQDSAGNGPQAAAMELADGKYSIEVSLAGGSGRASVTSPTWLTVEDGRAYARLLWSSPYYDYMIMNGVRYENETTDGSASSFTIPIPALDTPVEIIADTTAMGDPVEIHYTLTFYADTVGSPGNVPQEAARRVLTGALAFMIIGGIVNHFVKKSRQ